MKNVEERAKLDGYEMVDDYVLVMVYKGIFVKSFQ